MADDQPFVSALPLRPVLPHEVDQALRSRFHVSFSPTASTETHAEPRVLEPGSDFVVLVMEACNALSDAGGSRFSIGGFGQEEWLHDVGYELSVFVEQLPDLLTSIRHGAVGVVDMYSQGVERILTFRPSGDLVEIHCESQTAWRPNPESETTTRSELEAMLSQLAVDFARGLKAIDSEIVQLSPFSEWLEGFTTSERGRVRARTRPRVDVSRPG